MTKSVDRLRGSVERVTFHSEDTGFAVLRVKVPGHGDLLTVIGNLPSVHPGEALECLGDWVNDPKHGLQFKAREIRVVPPTSLEGIERYLGSGMVKGIGPHFARKLVKAFGREVFQVIEEQPERLRELPGIGKKRLEGVTRSWAEQKAVREIMVFLQSHKVGSARAVRIYKTYGEDAVRLVSENPYRLAREIHGIGFLTADAIAASLGFRKDSPLRAEAGVVHVLREMIQQGHCAALREELVEKCIDLLEIPGETVRAAILAAVRQGDLLEEPVDGEDWIWLTPLQRAELGIDAHLRRLTTGYASWQPIDPSRALPWVEKRTGLSLSPSQRKAAALALGRKVVVITGGPGVGKTTLVNSILKIVTVKNGTILLCAPTGRAAKRLGESTGFPAKTMHRLLEVDPKTGGFRRGPENTLDADLVVLDEASMVDVVLMNQFLRALPDRAALLIVGDVDQIPSVGPGSVLQDILRSGRVPVARLTEIFRQAAESKIIVNAHKVNRGEMPREEGEDFYFIPAETPEEILDRLLEVVVNRIPRRFGLDPTRQVQVLTPMNRGGLGARALNLELQRRLNPDPPRKIERFGSIFAEGDKVIQTVNNYDKDVFNGDIGAVHRVDTVEGTLEIEFDGRRVVYEPGELDEVSLAYAITIHKSQGSEYPAVVLPLSTQHYMMLQRNLLYTGLTRGRNLVVLIGQDRAVATAVRNVNTVRRRTALRQRLAFGEPGA